ncbi:MAG: DUF1028 domain-containing protein [Candidatus Bathyarchaeia archaeon]
MAFDSEKGDLGIAVESKFPAAGVTVPWAKAKVGAIAVQAGSNVSHGKRGLELLGCEHSAGETLHTLLEGDPLSRISQVAVVDAQGHVDVHTGADCYRWAGHTSGKGYSCQGNFLAGPQVVKSMAEAYEKASGELVDRLLAALSAGQAAGGDRRGQQSAALLVVREKGGYMGFTDKYVDLRVDDHEHPIEELHRIFRVYDMTLLSREDPKNLLTIDGHIAAILQRGLKKLGFYDGSISGAYDEPTQKAFKDFIENNNFESKLRQDGLIWKSVLNYLEEAARER